MKEGAGLVHFVGAGPGPLDLLTLRAERLIRQADLVAYDELVEPELLALTDSNCERLAIGYRARSKGAKHPILHPRVCEAAKAGALVVRLKSGDPLIFGRAAEEMQRLDAEGIGYHIVPGITAALAAASAGAWPLTQKGKSCSLRLMTWTAGMMSSVQAETLAIYMPRHGLAELAGQLLSQGWDSSTPAAYIQSALRAEQSITQARLGTLVETVDRVCDSRPGICLIGDTIQHSHQDGFTRKDSYHGARTDFGLHRIGQRQDHGSLRLGLSSFGSSPESGDRAVHQRQMDDWRA